MMEFAILPFFPQYTRSDDVAKTNERKEKKDHELGKGKKREPTGK